MQLQKTSLYFLLILFSGSTLFSQRYLSEVFSSVDVTSSITYGQNLSVVTGAPVAENLLLDVYQPQGDTLQQRPLILVAHAGQFLPPPFNSRCNGNRNDSVVVEMCKQFARRGFVAAAIDYRLGWNPLGNQNVRSGTFINAVYRSIQDVRTAVRFFRKDAATANLYGIDPTRIAAGGLESGAFGVLGAAYLNQYSELNIPKLIDPNIQNSYVDTALVGNLEATNTRPLCLANHTGYSSDLNAVFNLGGAIIDTTWIQAGEPVAISLHCPGDVLSPYNLGAVIVLSSGDFVMNVYGSGDLQSLNTSLGLNSNFPLGLSDPYTTIADLKNQGLDGLFPVLSQFAIETSPWDWWDTTSCPANVNQIALQMNPDMSAAKGRVHIDTLMGYAIPRLVCVLDLASACDLVANEPRLETPGVTLYPNPTRQSFFLQSEQAGNPIQTIEVFDAKGKQILFLDNLERQKYHMNHEELTPGIYLIRVGTNAGLSIHKLLLQP